MIATNKLPGTLMAAIRHFDPEVSADYIRGIKWPAGACCPKCGSVNVGTIASRGKFQCREKGCRKQFSLTTGTIMESSHLPLEQWIVAVWMIVNCRMGISSCEIARHLGCKQQSAWHLLHRVRHLFKQENQMPLRDVVQCDETYVGGIMKFMHEERRERAYWEGKTVVFGMLENATGNVRAMVVPSAKVGPIRESILANVEQGSELHTDNARVYDWAQEFYTRKSVCHVRGEYVAEDGTTTNGLEGFFNNLRRALKGCYVSADPEHLDAYVDETVFRYNVRKLSEWERFDKAMRLIVGKQLTYSELTDGAVR